jgi:hypothetical protein
MSKNSLLESSKTCLIAKYGEFIDIQEYSFDEEANTLVVKASDPLGRLIGYLTTWEDSGLIKHHLYK